jgi:THO complex subunit 4
MSEKLDQSLDEILSTRRKTARRGGRGGRRVPNPAKTTVAPIGGIRKNTRVTRGTVRTGVPNGPSSISGDSKIIVSNLVCIAITPMM